MSLSGAVNDFVKFGVHKWLFRAHNVYVSLLVFWSSLFGYLLFTRVKSIPLVNFYVNGDIQVFEALGVEYPVQPSLPLEQVLVGLNILRLFLDQVRRNRLGW